jgi:hypothetical protein
MSSQPVQKEESNLKHADRKFSYRGFDQNQMISKSTDELK